MSPGPGDDERRPSAEAPLTKSITTDNNSMVRDGLDQAIKNASSDWWYSGAMLAIKQLALTNRGFTVDHVFAMCGEPADPHYAGVVLAVAKRQGLVEPVGCREADDGRLVRVWWGIAGGAS